MASLNCGSRIPASLNRDAVIHWFLSLRAPSQTHHVSPYFFKPLLMVSFFINSISHSVSHQPLKPQGFLWLSYYLSPQVNQLLSPVASIIPASILFLSLLCFPSLLPQDMPFQVVSFSPFSSFPSLTYRVIFQKNNLIYDPQLLKIFEWLSILKTKIYTHLLRIFKYF